MKSENIFWNFSQITVQQRWERNGHRGCVVWLTGLSGSGKSTLARTLEQDLFARRFQALVLDGDNLRHGLNCDLGFSPEDRTENIRRAAEVGALLAATGNIAIIALISPRRQDRRLAREIAARSGCGFVEIFVDAPINICEERDPKHLYRKARAGLLRDFTGIDAPYEVPENAEIHVQTAKQDIEGSLATITQTLLPRLCLASP